MVDYPDYTLPIVVIGTVTVTGAVTVSGTVAISGTVTVTGAVTVTGSVTVSGTVAISGTVTVTGSVTVSGTVAISGSVAVTGTVAVSGTVTVTGTVAVSGTVTVAGAVTVSGTVAVSGTVTVSGTVAVSGTVTVTGSVTVSGTVAVSGTVTVTGSVTISGTVAVSGTVTITGSVTVSNTVTVTGSVTVSGTVAVSGTVTVTGSVTVSGTVSISGSVTVTGAVTISGPVTVTTVAADNIIIDKLTVGAYTERRSVLSNDGTLIGFETSLYLGKFFPRGCRGYLLCISVYTRNLTGVDKTVDVCLSPYPASAPSQIAKVTLTIPANQSPAWLNVYFQRFWNYDGLFIYTENWSDYANTGVGYDHTSPFDGWLWYEGIWQPHDNVKPYFRAVYKGQTCGDVPVSGIVNNIEIPNTSAGASSGAISVPTATETSVLTITGSGHVSRCAFRTDHSAIEMRLYIDGVWLDTFAFIAFQSVTGDSLNAIGYNKTTNPLQLMLYAVNDICYYNINMQIPFKRSFEVRAMHTAGANKNVYAGLIYEKIG